MMSTFTVSDYLIDSPNNKEYIQFQNQLLKNRQMQNRQFGHNQISLNQFNNYYNVSPQQYNGSDQYRRNASISGYQNNPSNLNNKEGLMINTKELVNGRNNNLNNGMNDSNGMQNMYNFNNNDQNVIMLNYLIYIYIEN